MRRKEDLGGAGDAVVGDEGSRGDVHSNLPKGSGGDGVDEPEERSKAQQEAEGKRAAVLEMMEGRILGGTPLALNRVWSIV